MKNMRSFYKFLTASIVFLLITIIAVGISNNVSSSNSSSSTASSSRNASTNNDEDYDDDSSSSQSSIKGIDPNGMWKDEDDGAAFSFNSNGTGRYVYADPDNPDTDDHFTWDYIGDNKYSIKMDDPDISGNLTATFHDDDTVTLSGGSDWNTETFDRASSSLDLDKFLEDHD